MIQEYYTYSYLQKTNQFSCFSLLFGHFQKSVGFLLYFQLLICILFALIFECLKFSRSNPKRVIKYILFLQKKTPQKTGRRVPVKCKCEEMFRQLTEFRYGNHGRCKFWKRSSVLDLDEVPGMIDLTISRQKMQTFM